MRRLPIMLTIAILLTAFHYGSTYDVNRTDSGGVQPKRQISREEAARNRARRRSRGNSPIIPRDPIIMDSVPQATEPPKAPVEVPELTIEMPPSTGDTLPGEELQLFLLRILPSL